jgi:phage-related tail protein
VSKLAESHERQQSTEEMLELTEEELEAATARLEDTARQLHRKEVEMVALDKARSDTQAMVAAQDAELRRLRSEVKTAKQQVDLARSSDGDALLGDQAWLDGVERSQPEQAAATVADAGSSNLGTAEGSTGGTCDGDARRWAAELLDDCISTAVAATSA